MSHHCFITISVGTKALNDLNCTSPNARTVSPDPRPKAYPVRFSAKRQAKGDSLLRQID